MSKLHIGLADFCSLTWEMPEHVYNFFDSYTRYSDYSGGIWAAAELTPNTEVLMHMGRRTSLTLHGIYQDRVKSFNDVYEALEWLNEEGWAWAYEQEQILSRSMATISFDTQDVEPD